ncbi:uncharacterized protein LOC117649505 [Thrips palmi]|uniref:Dynein axonemal assembly factor 1 homolog n=1 Tax=Thrips palmi TaxID=161013 RepID=A0A6P8ZT42_THRPL|nr:uncharacterized protein LOC117649505 [Thrips palmi]
MSLLGISQHGSTVVAFFRITRESLRRLCKENKGYVTPHLNDILYLHYKGYTKIENLEEYTGLKCLWLESNGICCIENLDQQLQLRCLYLHHNLISSIENLEHLEFLDTLNLSHNNLHQLQNLSALPALHTLNVSHNRLRAVEDVAELQRCAALGVLDLSHNVIEDPGVLGVLGAIPNLRVLTLTGNPVIKNVPNYRKAVTLACKQLTYLDARPVFDKDRRCAEAWEKGGPEAERAMRKELQDAENRRISDSVNGKAPGVETAVGAFDARRLPLNALDVYLPAPLCRYASLVGAEDPPSSPTLPQRKRGQQGLGLGLGAPGPQCAKLIEMIEEDGDGLDPPDHDLQDLCPRQHCQPQRDSSLLALEGLEEAATAGVTRKATPARAAAPRILIEEVPEPVAGPSVRDDVRPVAADEPGLEEERVDVRALDAECMHVESPDAGEVHVETLAGETAVTDATITETAVTETAVSEAAAAVTEAAVTETETPDCKSAGQDGPECAPSPDELEALARLEALVTQPDADSESRVVVPKYEWIRGRLPEACARRAAGHEAGQAGPGEAILDHQTIAQRYLDDLRARNDLSDEERAIMESIQRMATDSASDEDDSEASEGEGEAGPPLRHASSDSEDARDVVIGALRDFKAVEELPETEISREDDVQPPHMETKVTNAQIKQAKVVRKSDVRISRCVQIKKLLDQHENIMAMLPEERKQLTGQLLQHLQEWRSVEDKRRRKSQKQKVNCTDKNHQPTSKPEADDKMNKDDERQTADTTKVESDDDDDGIQEDEIIRNVSQTLEMQIASIDM